MKTWLLFFSLAASALAVENVIPQDLDQGYLQPMEFPAPMVLPVSFTLPEGALSYKGPTLTLNIVVPELLTEAPPQRLYFGEIPSIFGPESGHGSFYSGGIPPGLMAQGVPGIGGLGALGAHGGAAAFTGMGDVNTTNVKAAWGLRAYSAATRGNKLANVCDGSDVHCVDMLSDATTGDAIIPSSNPDCTGSACTIKTWYDISGQTNCAAAACDQVQATIAGRATLVLNCGGTTKPCGQRTSTGGSYSAAANISSQAQPYSMSVVASRTGAFTTQAGVVYMNGGGGDIEFSSTTGTALLYAGSVQNFTAANTTIHAIQALFNGASSNAYIDGTANTGNAGSGAYGTATPLLFSSGGAALIGQVFEAAAWSGDKSANNSSMNSNQHTYWGF